MEGRTITFSPFLREKLYWDEWSSRIGEYMKDGKDLHSVIFATRFGFIFMYQLAWVLII